VSGQAGDPTAPKGGAVGDPEAVTREQVVAAPPAEVFRWFVDPDLLARWIGIRATLEPRPGGSFRFEIVDGEWCSGRYLEVVPGRRVVFTWGWDSGAIPVPPGSSTVEVDLDPHPDGTLVRLVHRGLAPEVRRCTPAAGPGSCPAWPRSSPAASPSPTRPSCPRRSRGHRHQGRDRRRPAPRGGRGLPARPGQRPELDRRAALGPTGDRAAGGHRQPGRAGRLVPGPPHRVRQRDHRADRDPAGHALGPLALPDAGDLRLRRRRRHHHRGLGPGRGDARRLYRLADPLMAWLVRRSVRRDLRNLKRVLENGSGSPC
jgi:uncharacterized protein YndB with AHSA1/START domain